MMSMMSPAAICKTCRISAQSKAFSSEVGTGSRQENASNQKSRVSFRFHRNEALEFFKYLEQGIVEHAGILDLRNVTEPRQHCQARLRRKQRSEIKGLFDGGDRILVAPQDRDGDFQLRIGIAVRARGLRVGAEEIIQPVGDI